MTLLTKCLHNTIEEEAKAVPPEGEGFTSRMENKLRFLNIAQGSLEESRYYLILAEDLTYESSEEEMTKLEGVSRLFGIVLPIYPSCPLLTPDSFLYQA